MKSYILSIYVLVFKIYDIYWSFINNKHELLCSLPHGDIRIVIWPIYGHHQICQTPFKVIHICCFFHDSRPPYAKSVAFKIHSIEIEDQSHHWLPVVYLHEDTKGHLLSRWIAEKKLFNFIIIILILITSIPLLFSCLKTWSFFPC